MSVSNNLVFLSFHNKKARISFSCPLPPGETLGPFLLVLSIRNEVNAKREVKRTSLSSLIQFLSIFLYFLDRKRATPTETALKQYNRLNALKERLSSSLTEGRQSKWKSKEDLHRTCLMFSKDYLFESPRRRVFLPNHKTRTTGDWPVLQLTCFRTSWLATLYMHVPVIGLCHNVQLKENEGQYSTKKNGIRINTKKY